MAGGEFLDDWVGGIVEVVVEDFGEGEATRGIGVAIGPGAEDDCCGVV